MFSSKLGSGSPFSTDKSKKKVVLSFSGGKDSVAALRELQNSDEYTVVALLTTLDPSDKVLMHGFDSELLSEQAKSLGLPLYKITIPKVSNKGSSFAGKMKEAFKKFKEQGVTLVAYGDIYLEDVRKFREEKLSLVGMESIFPLWGKNTQEIAEKFINSGFRAVITCVNTKIIPKEWIGKEFNKEFTSFLVDKKIDPCGENGEFHTFVYAGPTFKNEVKFQFDFDNPVIYNEFYSCVAKNQSVSTTSALSTL